MQVDTLPGGPLPEQSPPRLRLGTVKQVAKLLGTGPAYPYQNQDSIPGLVKVGRLLRWDLDILETTLKARAAAGNGGQG